VILRRLAGVKMHRGTNPRHSFFVGSNDTLFHDGGSNGGRIDCGSGAEREAIARPSSGGSAAVLPSCCAWRTAVAKQRDGEKRPVDAARVIG